MGDCWYRILRRWVPQPIVSSGGRIEGMLRQRHGDLDQRGQQLESERVSQSRAESRTGREE